MHIIFCFTPHPSWSSVDSEPGVSPGRLAQLYSQWGTPATENTLMQKLGTYFNVSVLNTHILSLIYTYTHTHTTYTNTHILNSILDL